jgi:acyl carrier protein
MRSLKRETLKYGVKQILSEKLDIPIQRIKNKSLLRDELGLDSVKAIEIAFALEDKYQKKISNEALSHIKTVNDIVNIVIKFLG